MTRLRIARAELTALGGALGQTAGNARASWNQRRGVVLTLHDASGMVGVGEAAPLPGFSLDTLEAATAELEAVDWAAPGAIIEVADLAAASALLGARMSSPAARCALDSALLDLGGRLAGVPAARLLAAPHAPAQSAPLAAMIADLKQAEDQVAAAWARGIRCVKLKIGRPGRFADELALMRALRARYGAALRLRLDANRAWSLAEAAANLAALAEVAPELIEEPGPDLVGREDLTALADSAARAASAASADSAASATLAALASTSVLVAADESLAGASDAAIDAMLDRGLVRALVLKPMLLGGLWRCRDLAARAAARGIPSIVSHLLDGPVALAAYAQLALAITGAGQPGTTAAPGLAHGLDRHVGLSAWPDSAIAAVGAHALQLAGPGLGVTLS